MRSSSLNLLCRTANQLSRATTHPFSAISSPHPSKRLPSCWGGSPAADDAPSPHGEAARTQRVESTDEHACRITHLYFRKTLYFLAKHADFLQLLLECSFPSRAQVRTRQVVFVFSLHLFTRLLQRYDCQCVWCEGFCISPSPSASHSRSPPHRTKSLLFCGIIFKSSGVPNRNSRR